MLSGREDSDSVSEDLCKIGRQVSFKDFVKRVEEKERVLKKMFPQCEYVSNL